MSPAGRAAKAVQDVGHASAPWAAIAAIALLIIQGQMNQPQAAAQSTADAVLSVKLDNIETNQSEMNQDFKTLSKKLDPVLSEIVGLKIRVGALEQRASE